MRLRHAVLAVLVLALTPAAAYADEDPGSCQKTCGGAAFSPAFSDSPVTLVICAVPDSCRLTSGGPR